LPRENVCEVQAGGFNPNQNLAQFWLRIGTLFDFHYPNVSGGGGDYGSHEVAQIVNLRLAKSGRLLQEQRTQINNLRY
jgi:hypothetical protein